MANDLYPEFIDAALSGAANCDLLNDTVKVALIDTGTYTFDAADEFLSDLSGITAHSAALTTKALTAGAFSSDAAVFTAVTGAQSEALVLYVDTGVAGTSRLVAYIDTGITGFPFTPNGGNLTVTPDAGGWFSIT